MGIGRAALVTASRGLNAALLLVAGDPTRFDRVATVPPYMQLEAEPDPPDPEWLESLRCEADADVPLALAECIVAATPNARLEVIRHCGHRPDIRTPELVAPLLLDFLLDP